MNVGSDNDEIITVVGPVVEGLGFELVDVQVARGGRRRIVRVLADRPAGGIALADCARISRALAVALEATNVADGSYTLEVSSPGLDRPLVTARDFQRCVGEHITLYLTDGQKLEGALTAADESQVVLDGGEPIPRTQVKHGTRNY